MSLVHLLWWEGTVLSALWVDVLSLPLYIFTFPILYVESGLSELHIILVTAHTLWGFDPKPEVKKKLS